jgi:hypothetical protein
VADDTENDDTENDDTENDDTENDDTENDDTETDLVTNTSADPEGATPPGYDWPTHGGYLGCLIAVMLACLLAPLGYIVVGFLGAFLAGPLDGFGVAVAIALTVIGYLALFVGLARLGWRMGRRYLREYPQSGMGATKSELSGEEAPVAQPRKADADAERSGEAL